MTWICFLGGFSGQYSSISLVARSSSWSVGLFKRSSRSSGIVTFHSLSLSASIPAKSFCFSALIAFLRSPTRLLPSIWTGKAFAVVFPLTRHSKVIDMFSAYIVFFAKFYWCKLAYVGTRIKKNFICEKIQKPSICEKFSCRTDCCVISTLHHCALIILD